MDIVDKLVAWGCNLLHLTKYQKVLTQLAKFVIAGIINTIIDWGIFFSLYNLVGANLVVAQMAAFTTATIVSFFINTAWVFNTTKRKTRRRLVVEFFALNFVALGMTTALIYVFIDILQMNELLSKVLTTAIAMVYNYITRKWSLEDRPKKARARK